VLTRCSRVGRLLAGLLLVEFAVPAYALTVLSPGSPPSDVALLAVESSMAVLRATYDPTVSNPQGHVLGLLHLGAMFLALVVVWRVHRGRAVDRVERVLSAGGLVLGALLGVRYLVAPYPSLARALRDAVYIVGIPTVAFLSALSIVVVGEVVVDGWIRSDDPRRGDA